MKFNDYPYTRPNLETLTEKSLKLLETMRETNDFEVFHDAFKSLEKLNNTVATQITLASIRNSIDTQDEFYENEISYWDEHTPQVQALMAQAATIILNSDHKEELMNHYPAPYFQKLENTLRVFDDTIIEDLQLENKLTTQYNKLIAGAEIQFDDKTLNLAQMTPYTQSENVEVRKAATEASWNFFNENENELDDIYDQLVKVRTKMAHQLGFETFTEMAYLRMDRLDYDQEMVANYRQQVLDEVVPVASKLYQRQAKRLNVEKLNYYDVSLNFLDGNAKPIGDAQDILAAGKEMYHQLSQETGEWIDLMLDNNLMDVLAKPKKSAGGYMTFLYDYGVPFIFSNFNGTSGDIDVLTHEAGHAFQGYQSRHVPLSNLIMPTNEACEIHSMSMEFLTWPYMDKFFGDKADKYRFTHLSEALQFLPYGVLVDHFQHEVYNHPEMTVAQRKETWRKLDQKYRPHLDFSENQFLNQGVWWYRQGHIFASPFYYIDYTLAQVCAFQFWKRKFVDEDENTWKDYLHICQIGGTKTFTQIVKEANLISPFDTDCLKSVIGEVDNWLESVDDLSL